MLSFRSLALGGVVAALVVAAPAIGVSGKSQQGAVPPAQVAGGDPLPPIPSIVNTRIVRAQDALGRATADFDENQAASAVVPMGAAADNLTKGWSAAKWLIQNAPPPPADDAISDGPVPLTYAGPEDSTFALFSAQHDLVAASVGMMETTNAALLQSLRNSMTSAQESRTTAIEYIHSIAPLPPVDDAVGDGLEGAVTWDVVMPNLIPVLQDEVQQINGRLAMYAFSASARTALTNARSRANEAIALVTQYWAPPTED